LAPLPALAQPAFPTRPLRILTAFAAGGGTDLIARTLAQAMTAPLGQSVIVENKPGAGGNLATDTAAQAPADGYTMLMGNHGALVTGATIAEAFEEMYYLERACQTLVLAYSTGQPLNILSNDLALKTASDWDDYQGMAFAHFRDLKKQLDQYNPGYEQ
jgi:tripartite-type tricarboxylate transporter receptor subunit TctC